MDRLTDLPLYIGTCCCIVCFWWDWSFHFTMLHCFSLLLLCTYSRDAREPKADAPAQGDSHQERATDGATSSRQRSAGRARHQPEAEHTQPKAKHRGADGRAPRRRQSAARQNEATQAEPRRASPDPQAGHQEKGKVHPQTASKRGEPGPSSPPDGIV
jgi:hypothetical protein